LPSEVLSTHLCNKAIHSSWLTYGSFIYFQWNLQEFDGNKLV
jgi:hypothetical protein